MFGNCCRTTWLNQNRTKKYYTQKYKLIPGTKILLSEKIVSFVKVYNNTRALHVQLQDLEI